MLTALVLVCSVATTPDLSECTLDSARTVMRVPEEFSSPTVCLMHGQAYLSETSIGRTLADGDRIKVVCRRSAQVAAVGG